MRKVTPETDRRIEYFHKRSFYLLPARSKIFENGNRVFVEVYGRKSGISKYVVERPELLRSSMYKIGLPITGGGSQLSKKYQAIADYLTTHPNLDYLHFDHATSNDLALCTFFKSNDLIQINNLIGDMQSELPFLLNIFRRPVIHLKETDIVQPIDTVKRVNHNTVRHLSTRTENWESLDRYGDVVPRKLLTKVYEDDYSIYENVVFRDLIDNLLTFLRKRIFHLSETLNALEDSVRLDAFNRINHETYYLAIGKLYVGFFKTENSDEMMATLKNAKQLYKQLAGYKARAVYAKNSGVRAIAGEVKRTNILGMHKDYRHVYMLSQKMSRNSFESKEAGTYDDQRKSQKNYELFCQMLTVFAVSTFNMKCARDATIFENGKTDAYFEFKDWSLVISVRPNEILDLNTIFFSVAHKDTTTNYLFIPMSYHFSQDKKRRYEYIVERLYQSGEKCDKYVFLEPFDFDDNHQFSYSIRFDGVETELFYAILPVSISEINSFRRIQKLLFECMVTSDPEHKDCAFCGEPLAAESGNKFVCKKCRTAVKLISCAQCGKEFKVAYADIKQRARKGKEKEDQYLKELPEFYRQEKKHLFRSIVNMKDTAFLCPHCNGENK